MTSVKQLQNAISKIKIWSKGDERAPHKPLLLLYVLSKYKQGHGQFFDYEHEVHGQLLDLLRRFGPARREHYPMMPFWRLKGDGFWALKNAEFCSPERSKEPSRKALFEHKVAGGFDEANYQLIRKKPSNADKLACQLLEKYFPESIQNTLADLLGFEIEQIKKTRDPAFRQAVLRAYHYECAICGFNLRCDDTLIGLEAAHIKWKCYHGPCIVPNGLALCSLHHSAFDIGSIGFDEKMRLMVSEGVNGNGMVQKLFWDFAGKALRLPMSTSNYPDEGFVAWHREQVFKQ